MATCCLPPLRYEIGFDHTPPPIGKFQSDLPVAASSAKNSPCTVPPNTTPPAVAMTPPHGGRCSLNSHCTSPVCGFSARTAPQASSPGTLREPPPLNSAP